MSKRIPTSARVPISASRATKFDLSCRHIGTTNFGELKPLYCESVIPSDRFTLDVQSFTRLDPMPAPSMAEMFVHTRAFFVPYNTIFRGFSEFIANTQNTSASATLSNFRVPYMLESTVDIAFADSSLSTKASSKDNPWDIAIVREYDPLGMPVFDYYKLTPQGRRIYNILVSLGYNFTFDKERDAMAKYSLLPLIAFCKVYLDWYVPSKYWQSDADIIWLRQFVHADFDNYNNLKTVFLNNGSILTNTLIKLFNIDFSVFFTQDYFSNCLANPFGNSNNVDFNDVEPSFGNVFIDGQNSVVSDKLSGASIQQVTSGSDVITALDLKTVGQLQKIVNKGMVIDNKVQDYLRVTFGIEPSSDALRISKYIGHFADTIKVGDVMSNADTMSADSKSGAVLGQFAGRGLGYQQGHFTFSAGANYGLVLVLQDIVPTPFYFQGISTPVTAIDRLDFFTPEFDSICSSPVSMRRLFNDQPLKYYDTVFGYLPQYSEYKVGHDVLSGNFRLHSVNADLSPWYQSRQLPMNESRMGVGIPDLPTASSSFTKALWSNPFNNFNSIFYQDGSVADPFYQIHDIKVMCYRKAKSLIDQLFDDDDYKHGSTDVDLGGTIGDRN
ncbi:MAG: major capsid protein [Microviridae sp.]|nr:MAG: major capsid protein [Microviridae sp.]